MKKIQRPGNAADYGDKVDQATLDADDAAIAASAARRKNDPLPPIQFTPE